MDFVPAATPRIGKDQAERPEHLADLADAFDRIARGQVVRACYSYPPQHGKTTVLEHGLARALATHPDWPTIYASYSADAAEAKSLEIRDVATRLGVELRDDAASKSDWLTPDGGGLRARGVFQGIAGLPAKIAVVDDAFAKREDAESALVRQKTHEWFTGDLLTRCHPDTSIIVCGTRWHPDDLIGRLALEVNPQTHRPAYEVHNRPAVLPDGQPLWHRRPLDFLAAVRAQSEYDWQSLWMGNPRARGESVFRGVHYYDRLPARFAIGKGTDLAYTRAKRACHSAGVVMLADHPDPLVARYYVVDVRRRQVEAPEFAAEMRGVDVRWPGPWHWYYASSEKGSAQLLALAGVEIRGAMATVDKFVRAQPLAAAWNAGRVLIPRTVAALSGDRAGDDGDDRQVPWLKDFVDEIGNFTGVSDRSNDQVDAAASAHASLNGAPMRDDAPARDDAYEVVDWEHRSIGY